MKLLIFVLLLSACGSGSFEITCDCGGETAPVETADVAPDVLLAEDPDAI